MERNLLKKILFVAVMITSSIIFAQTVSGTVSDGSGPLPGANVLIKGTSTGVTTDFDGNYTINARENDILVFSFLGYLPQEVKVGNQSNVSILLKEDAAKLEEVVVLGYSSQVKGDITGSVAEVDMEEALKTPNVNAAESLQGRVTGVTVLNDPSPGGTPVISIRGLGTMNSTGPLFIIDGVQTTDASIFNSINASDIAQMNVLKDGAAAIYGARAANGVIIVTTKGGGYNQGRTKIKFDTYTGVSYAKDGPDLLNPQQHGQMLWDGMLNDGSTPSHPQYGNGASPVVPSFLLDDSGNPLSPRAAVNPNGTDWWDEITRAATTVNASLSLSNGTENSKSYASVSYLGREGVLKHNGFKRANIQLNNEFKAFDKLKIGEHVNVAFSQIKGGGAEATEYAFRASPLIPVYDENGDFAGTYSNSYGLSNAHNPVSLLTRAKDNYTNSFRMFGDVYLSYEILEGLTFKTTLAGSVENSNGRFFTPLNPEHGEPRSFNTLEEESNNSVSWTWTNMLNYNTTIAENHNLNVFAAIESFENRGKGHGISNTDYFNESPDFYLLNNGFGTPNVDYAYELRNTLFSVFGSADYNFAQKYFFTGTVRYDKSSRFSGSNKSDVFPSFSAGWVVNKEDFYPEDAWVNRLKVKGSWGELGNQALPVNNPTLSLFSFNSNNSNYAFNPGQISSGAYLSQLGNENLKWETSVTSNVGIEVGMFDSKLQANFELWQIKTTDLIVQDNFIISTTAPDAAPPYVNVGDVKNTGFDFDLGYSNKTAGGFSYSVNANISHYKNEVVSLIGGNPIGGSSITGFAGAYTRTEEGEPLSYFYGRVIEGFDADGRWVYKDVNGDGTVDDDDRTKIGSPHPDFTYGINLSGDYKGFDFSVFFNGSQGNDVYNHNKIYTDFPLFANGNRSTRVLDSWTPTNTDASLPALSNSLHGNEINANSYFVEDGSFFRLKNIQIGYTLPESISDKMKMESLRFYISGTNLFTITGYEGVDPEIAPIDNLNMGIDIRTFPISSIYTVGLNLKF